MSSSSSSFDTTITATEAAQPTDWAPADEAEVPKNEKIVEEMEDRKEGEGGNGLFHERQTEEVEYIGCSPPPYQHHSTNFYHNYRQIKINLIVKQSNVITYSISTTTAQR